MDQFWGTIASGLFAMISTWVAVATYLKSARKDLVDAKVARAVERTEVAASIKALADSVQKISEGSGELAERQREHAEEQTKMIQEVREQHAKSERSIEHLRQDVTEIRKTLQSIAYSGQPIMPQQRRAGMR